MYTHRISTYIDPYGYRCIRNLQKGGIWGQFIIKMPVKTGVVLLIVLVVAVTAASVAYGGSGEYSTSILTLVRAFPANKTVELEILKTRDRVRHARILQGFGGGVVDFTVSGTSDPYYGG